MDEADTEHGAAALEGGVGVGRAVIDVQALGQTTTLDGGAQHVLTGARVLVWHPAAMHQQPRIIVDEHKEVGALAATGARMGDEGTHQHVTDPHLVGSRSFETPVGPRLTGECGTLQAAALEVLANGALGDTNAVASEQDGADLGG